MQIHVIINSSAGTVTNATSDLTPAAVEAAFREAGLNPEIHYVAAEEIGPATRAALAKRPDAIVVGGGDGTLNTAAGILVDTRLPLGILPLGTLNHFSKDLQIPNELAAAVAIIAAQHVRAVDVAEVNGRIFLNNCSIGAYPQAVRRRDELRERHGHGKWRAMTRAWIEVLRNLRRLRVQLTIDQKTVSRRTPVVLVSNNHYVGQLFSSQLREQLDEGKFWVYTTRHYRVLPLLRLTFLAAVGRLEEANGFECWAAKEATLMAQGTSIKAGTDGEVTDFQLPLRFRIRPGALQVFAPSPTK